MIFRKLLLICLCWILVSVQSSSADDLVDTANEQIVPIVSQLLFSNNGGVEMVRAIAEKYAVLGRSQVVGADKAAVQNFIGTFPPGDSPLDVSGYGNSLTANITSSASAFFMVGVQAVAQDSRAVALWCFAEATALNPFDPVYVNSLAFELIEFEHHAEAVKLLSWALKSAPDFADAKVNLAYIRGGEGRHEEAGNLYHQALLIEPGDAHSAYAAAREYLAANEQALAWLMTGLGLDNFSTSFDFSALQAKIKYPPDGGDAQCQGSCIGNCADVFNSWMIETIAWNSKSNDFRNSVYDPAITNADKTRYYREQAAMDHLRECDDYFSPKLEICRCESWVAHDSASPSRFASWYGSEALLHEVLVNNHEAKWKEIWAYYEQQEHLLTTADKSYLICFFESQQLSEELDLYQTRRLELSDHQNSLSNARRNLAITTDFYCQESIFYDWFFTLEFIESYEPKICTGPICYSKDLGSGDYATEVNAGFAFKLSRNPHTGRGVMSIGVGKSVGLASFNFGGAVQATIGGGKVGLVAKASLGWYDKGLFVGLKHQRTNWSSYP